MITLESDGFKKKFHGRENILKFFKKKRNNKIMKTKFKKKKLNNFFE